MQNHQLPVTTSAASPIKTVLCIGVAVEDRIFKFDQLPTEAKKYRASALQITGGGGAANAAVAVQRLGGRACLVARLGDDDTANALISSLRKDGVDCRAIRRFPGRCSSQSAIFIDARGERLIANYRDAGLPDDASWINADGLSPDAIVADTKWPGGANRAMQLARQLGIPGVLDAEQPLHDNEIAIRQASHVIFSMQGLQSYRAATDPLHSICQIAAEQGNWVAVTDGANGVYWANGQQHGQQKAHSVNVVDTLAAGDTWHGAFALRLAENHCEAIAMRFANAAAAIKCTRFGGRDGIPHRAEVEQQLASTRER